MLALRELRTSAGNLAARTPKSESRSGTPNRRQSAAICPIQRSAASSAGVSAATPRTSRANSASCGRQTSRFTRRTTGSIAAQANPCGTRQWIPRPPPPRRHAQAGIRQRDAGKQGGLGHRLPRRPRRPVSCRNFNRRNRQLQAGNRQRPWDGTGLARNVALDELRDGVHAAGHRDGLRRRDRQTPD